MCKIKKYGQLQQKFATAMYVRVEYFSLPGYLKEFSEKKRDYLVGDLKGKIAERPLTQVEQQIVDVDDISNDLDVTIEELISRNVYVFSDLQVGSQKAKLFVSHYFAHLEIELQDAYDRDEISEYASKILDMDGLLNCVSIVNHELGLRHVVQADDKQIWTLLDQDAFKGIDELPVNGRYYDEYESQQNLVGSQRRLRQLADEKGEGLKLYIADILTMTLMSSVSVETLSQTSLFLEQESTRCFNC